MHDVKLTFTPNISHCLTMTITNCQSLMQALYVKIWLKCIIGDYSLKINQSKNNQNN